MHKLISVSLDIVLHQAMERCKFCFEKINNRKFHTGQIQVYHTVQYAMFLYFVMNEVYESCLKNNTYRDCQLAQLLCDKLFAANTALSGVDIFYEQKLPEVFLMAHTSGIVLTPHAKIGNYFMLMQGCNIGYSKGNAPVLGEGVIMWGHSKIIGKCNIGDHVMFGANSYIKDMDIPSNSIVFGQYPNVIIKENREDEVMEQLHERFIL